VDESVDRDTFRQLVGVIAWELDAQTGVDRPIEKIPPLVADTILDYLDIRLNVACRFPVYVANSYSKWAAPIAVDQLGPHDVKQWPAERRVHATPGRRSMRP
jgi:hypothetical protein